MFWIDIGFRERSATIQGHLEPGRKNEHHGVLGNGSTFPFGHVRSHQTKQIGDCDVTVIDAENLNVHGVILGSQSSTRLPSGSVIHANRP